MQKHSTDVPCSALAESSRSTGDDVDVDMSCDCASKSMRGWPTESAGNGSVWESSTCKLDVSGSTTDNQQSSSRPNHQTNNNQSIKLHLIQRMPAAFVSEPIKVEMVFSDW